MQIKIVRQVDLWDVTHYYLIVSTALEHQTIEVSEDQARQINKCLETTKPKKQRS